MIDYSTLITAFSGTLMGGGIVMFLLRDKLQEQAQLRNDHASLKREVEGEHARQIEANQVAIQRLTEQSIRQGKDVEQALAKLGAVDFGVLSTQLQTLNRQVENLVQAERAELANKGQIDHRLRTLDARVDRAHEKIDKLTCNHGGNCHGQ